VSEPTRDEVDQLAGATVLEFGASWCGYCTGARPLVDAALATRADVRHLWIEDGRGKRLGRSFRVKLWPTLIFLVDGREVARVVRPTRASELADALAQLGP
jgi:thioredoxin 1